MIQSVNKYHIYEIFASDGKFYYSIPKYQREYTWSYREWDALYDDISENNPEYFIGSIICIPLGDSINPYMEVIDGQQRLTTVSLFLAAIYTRLRDYKAFMDEDDEDYGMIILKVITENGEELLADVEGITLHENPSPRYDSNYWLNTVVLDPSLRVKGEEKAYQVAIQGAVGGAAGVTHQATTLHTDCEPNTNVEAMRMALDAAGIESRPLWKPMHLQPVYRRNPHYVNGVSESLFKQGLCLPSGPCVSDEDVAYIVEEIRKAIIR